jgi:S-adenosylmethionine:tRNA ribosyltransferase-isomerase
MGTNKFLSLNEYDYNLPKQLIAQFPMEPRDHSKLLVLDIDKGLLEDRHFYDLPHYLTKGDVLVFNDTRVMPARLFGKTDNGSTVELLLLKQIHKDTWRALVKPGHKMRKGTQFIVGSNELSCKVDSVEDDGTRLVVLPEELNLMDEGVVPVPPYINQELNDPERYQTVYSSVPKSVAAPTAGLHFTQQLIEDLRKTGVKIIFVTLDIGWGTFRPISADNVYDHQMEAEEFLLPESAAKTINQAKREGRRVISVGTTCVRLLESNVEKRRLESNHIVRHGFGDTNLFISPGHQFKIIDGLVSNFHLPKSTLLLLVSGFIGKENLFKAYNYAVKNDYRFYSFGDAMLMI